MPAVALEGEGDRASFAAPLLLFVPAVLARIEPAFAAPLPLFGTLLALVLLIAWRAIATGRGALYYWAAFFAIATQAAWSSVHLTVERLRTAVVIYAVFGVAATAIPIVARRIGPAAAARGGRRGRAHREPRAAAVPVARIDRAGGAVGAGAAAGDHQRGTVRRKRVRRAAARRRRRKPRVLGRAGQLVASRRRRGRRRAVPGGADGALADDDGRSRVDVTCGLEDAADEDGTAATSRFDQGLYLGLIGHLFLLFVAVNPDVVAPAVAVAGDARRVDAGREHRCR